MRQARVWFSLLLLTLGVAGLVISEAWRKPNEQERARAVQEAELKALWKDADDLRDRQPAPTTQELREMDRQLRTWKPRVKP